MPTVPARLLLTLVLTAALSLSCGGGDKKESGGGSPVADQGSTIGTPAPAATAAASPVAAATPNAATVRDLQAQVDAGRLDQQVFENIKNTGASDTIVVLNEEKALETLRKEAAARGIQLSEERIVEMKPQIYAELKKQLAGGIGGGGAVVQDFDSLGVIQVRFTSGTTLLTVLRRDEVEGVRDVKTYKRQTKESLPLINQPQATKDGFTGAGTTVAVLDTGVNYRNAAFGPCDRVGFPANKCRVVFAADVLRNDGQLDDDGHGTNVSGIVAGVAPQAKLAVLDVFQGEQASDQAVLVALDWVIKNKATYNIVAVNLSLGSSQFYFTAPCTRSPYATVFRDLRAAGILPVVAAGNEGIVKQKFRNGLAEPACTPGALSVGAVYDADTGRRVYGEDCSDEKTAANQITCFSQTGPNLGLLAPGSRITAGGVTQGGTSQAAPHVAGAVAALASKCKRVTIAQMEQALTGSGPEVPDRRNNVTKRRLDLVAAGKALNAAGACR